MAEITFCAVVLLMVIGLVMYTIHFTQWPSQKQVSVPKQHQRSTVNGMSRDGAVNGRGEARTRQPHTTAVHSPRLIKEPRRRVTAVC